MKAELKGDTGDFICTTLAALDDGQAIIENDGFIRLKVNAHSYIIRDLEGNIALRRSEDWPPGIKGGKVKMQLIMKVVR